VIASLSLGSCQFNPKKLTPHFIDIPNNRCTQYEIKGSNDNLVFSPVENKSLSACDGMVALPLEQVLEMRREWEAEHSKPKKQVLVNQ
jgi:hypothetical protein